VYELLDWAHKKSFRRYTYIGFQEDCDVHGNVAIIHFMKLVHRPAILLVQKMVISRVLFVLRLLVRSQQKLPIPPFPFQLRNKLKAHRKHLKQAQVFVTHMYAMTTKHHPAILKNLRV